MSLAKVDRRVKFRFLDILGSGSSAVVLHVQILDDSSTSRKMPSVALKWGVPLKRQNPIQEHLNTLKVIDWDYTPKALGYIRKPPGEKEEYYLDEFLTQAPGEKSLEEVRVKINKHLRGLGRDFSVKKDFTLSKSPQFVLIMPKFDTDLENFRPARSDLPRLDTILERLIEQMAVKNFEHRDFRTRNLLVCLGPEREILEVVLADWGEAGPFPEGSTIEERKESLRRMKRGFIEKWEISASTSGKRRR